MVLNTGIGKETKVELWEKGCPLSRESNQAVICCTVNISDPKMIRDGVRVRDEPLLDP